MKKIFALILAIILIFAMAACSEENSASSAPEESKAASEPASVEEKSEASSEEEIHVMSYMEFMAVPLEDGAGNSVENPVVIESYIHNIQCYSSWGNTSIYLADETGAYFVYRYECSQEQYDALKIGDRVRVEGYKTAWAGEVEIKDAKITVIEGSTYTAPYEDVTALWGTDDLADKKNRPVTFNDITVVPYDEDGAAYKFKNDEDGNDIYFKVQKGETTYEFTVETDLCNSDTDVYKAVKELKVGDVINLSGYLYWYEGPNTHTTKVEKADK